MVSQLVVQSQDCYVCMTCMSLHTVSVGTTAHMFVSIDMIFDFMSRI